MKFAKIPDEPAGSTLNYPSDGEGSGSDASLSPSSDESEADHSEEEREKRLKELQEQVCSMFSIVPHCTGFGVLHIFHSTSWLIQG